MVLSLRIDFSNRPSCTTLQAQQSADFLSLMPTNIRSFWSWFAVFSQLNSLHRPRPFVKRLAPVHNGLSVSKADKINAGKPVSDLLCASAFP